MTQRIYYLCSASLVAILVLHGVACDSGAASRKNARLAYWHLRLAKDYLRKRNAELAKTELLRATKLDPKAREVHSLLGVIYFLEGVHAMNFIDRKRCVRGDAAKQQRQEANRLFRHAERHLKRGLALGKKERPPAELNYLANISMHFGRYDEAISLSSEALENIMYTERHISLGTRGQAYFKKGDLPNATKDLRQAIFHRAGFCVGRFWLAKIHYKEKQYDRAIVELERVVKDGACPLQEAHQLLGLSYLKKQAKEKARVQFGKCVAQDPKSCVSLECQRYAKMI